MTDQLHPAADGDLARGGQEAARLLAAAASAARPWAVGLIEELVCTESHASQADGVNAVGGRLSALLAEAGCVPARVSATATTELPPWLTGVMLSDGGRYDVADVWVAERAGPGRPVLLLGDLDTAFLPGATARAGYRESGGRGYGPGIADMKGGLVVLALAVRLLAETGLAAPALRVVLSPDEQAGSLASRTVIRERARDCGCCLTFECARNGGHLMQSRAAVGLAQISVHGIESYAGANRAEGRSAVAGFARLVGPIEQLTDTELGRLLTVTLVQGGWRRSLVPGECSFVVDMRARDAAIWDVTEAELAGLVRTVCEEAGLTATVHVAQHRPAVTPTAETAPLKRLALQAGALLGLEFGFVSSHAAGSSAFANTIPVLDGMGPPGGDLMTAGEYIELAGLTERAALAALILHLQAER